MKSIFDGKFQGERETQGSTAREIAWHLIWCGTLLVLRMIGWTHLYPVNRSCVDFWVAGLMLKKMRNDI